jgi:hypothetical protein
VPIGSRIRPALGFTQPPIQWVPGALSPGVKRQGREADHSPPTSAEVKKMWIYTSPHTPSWRGALLLRHRDNFTLPCHRRLSLLSYSLPCQKCSCISLLSHVNYTTRAFQSPSRSSSLRSFLQALVISSILGSNVLIINVRDKISHASKIANKLQFPIF